MKILIAVFLSIQCACFLPIQDLYGQVIFQKCDPAEIPNVKDSMLSFYGEQLVQAGLFENSQLAKEAAILEWDQEEQKPTKEIFYYLLISSVCQDKWGYVVYSIEDYPTAYLEAMYLEAPYRGQGLGRHILQDFEALLSEKEVQNIRLYVFAHNHRAIDLYKKVGYEIETTYFRDNTPIGHHMKKELQK